MATPSVALTLPMRPMTEADLPGAFALSQKLHWPHRREDWQLMLRLSHGVVIEDAGQIIGTAFCCVQGGYSTIGLVIVADEYQGRGLGRQLMQQALALSGDAVATLTATVEGAPLYEKLGFVTYDTLAQHQVRVDTGHEFALDPAVRSLRPSEHSAAQALALAAHGFSRGAMLEELLAMAEDVVVTETAGALSGLAVLRPFGRGWMIGPIIAESPDQAQLLISALLARCTERFVRIDVTVSSGLSDWLTSVGVANVDRPVLMARGEPPHGDGRVRQFGVVTQALG